MLTDTLVNIVYKIRAEAGHSLLTSQGQNTVDVIKYLAQRTQIELWTAYQWPTLKIRVDQLLAAGQYLYIFPGAPGSSMSFEQIREVWANVDSPTMTPVAYGITEEMIAPGGANTVSGDGVQYWDAAADQIRVWPTPVSSRGFDSSCRDEEARRLRRRQRLFELSTRSPSSCSRRPRCWLAPRPRMRR